MIDLLEYIPFRLLKEFTRILSFRIAGKLGASVGALVYHVTGFRKRVTLENLRRAFPEMDIRQRREIALTAYKSYARTLIEMLWATSASEESLLKTVDMNDRTLLDRHLQTGKGMIILSSHMGGWEHLAHGFRLHIGKPVNMIVQRQRNKHSDALIDGGRRRHGNNTIPMGPGAREALGVLRAGGVLAALADQSASRESVYVDFFGRPAATHRGIAAFSLKTGSPILMTILVRQSNGTYKVTLEEVDKSDIQGYTEENILELTRRHVALLEKYVRKYPGQWLWMHKRWKHTESYLSQTSSGDLK